MSIGYGTPRVIISISAAAMSLFPAMLAAQSPEPFDQLVMVFRERCARCHGEGDEVQGEVDLAEIKSADDLLRRPNLLSNLLRVVRDGEMPPIDEPQLSRDERSLAAATIQTFLNESLRSVATPPRTPIRRMNRFQYSNSVRDLLELKIEIFELPESVVREHKGYFQPASRKMPDQLVCGNRPLGKSQLIAPRLSGVASFPQDLRAENGFDNRGDLLTLSPALMESFVALSSSIFNSVDFNSETCGIWEEFFAPPPTDADTMLAMRERLRPFLTRAFRRPIDEESLDRYVEHAFSLVRDGRTFTDAMKEVAGASLVSPRFLYLGEGRATGDRSESLDDFELASRLSYFLWGSVPDDTLLEVAATGRLREPAVLSSQVDRMLDDRRLKRFCDTFPSQWMQLEQIVASVPDPDRFPEYYSGPYRASMHAMLEPLLLFEAILVEDHSILKLIDSDFTYRSQWLRSLYDEGRKPDEKIEPTSIRFDRVSITDRRQGGVITSAAVMAMTSTPVRTQPITRGAWVVGVIFNDPPSPPPANVPPLDEDVADTATAALTLREKLQAHRQQADCAACHAKIDPFGFALENYNAIGLWRDKYESGQPIDASGRLFNSRDFSDIIEFKDALLENKDRFARAFAAHLLSFALARQLQAADEPALDEIVKNLASEEYRMRGLIRHIVLSEPFRTKFNPAISLASEQ